MSPRADDPTVDPARAAVRIAAAMPALRPVRVVHLGRGWDHEVYLANEAWVFRFPRNAAAADALATETVILPWLAPRVPSAVPEPAYCGAPDATTGWRFARHGYLPGVTVCDAALDADARAALAPALARFVRALHALPPGDAPCALPPDVLHRFDVARRGPATRAHLAAWQHDGTLPSDAAARLLRALDDCPALPRETPRVIVHADLHSRNLLVDTRGAIAGVIDWVDVHHGERAVDLAAAYEVLPPHARDAFFAHYGSADAVTVTRARWRAIDHATRSLAGATERGDTRFAAACRRALVETATE